MPARAQLPVLGDRRLLRPGLQMRPVGLLGDPEDVFGRFPSGSSAVADEVILLISAEAKVPS